MSSSRKTLGLLHVKEKTQNHFLKPGQFSTWWQLTIQLSGDFYEKLHALSLYQTLKETPWWYLFVHVIRTTQVTQNLYSDDKNKIIDFWISVIWKVWKKTTIHFSTKNVEIWENPINKEWIFTLFNKYENLV